MQFNTYTVAGAHIAVWLVNHPAPEAAALAAELPQQTKVVDLGAGFRLADAASWARFYGGDHPGTWTYGLPELPGARAKISAASRVASPGCFATASILALTPLLAHGVAEPGDIVIVAASGPGWAAPSPSSGWGCWRAPVPSAAAARSWPERGWCWRARSRSALTRSSCAR